MPVLADVILEALIRKQARKSALPAALIQAIIERESGGRPTAVGDSGKALGLMQVHPAAAAESGHAHDDMSDPEKGVDAGATYLSSQVAKFTDPALALSSYNAGPTATRRAGGVAPSAAGYVDQVMARVAELTAPGAKYESDTEVLPDSAAETMSLEEVLNQDRIARLTKQITAMSRRKKP